MSCVALRTPRSRHIQALRVSKEASVSAAKSQSFNTCVELPLSPSVSLTAAVTATATEAPSSTVAATTATGAAAEVKPLLILKGPCWGVIFTMSARISALRAAE